MKAISGQNKVLLRSFVITLIVVGLFTWVALLIGQHRIEAFDNRITDAIQGLRSDTLTAWMKRFTAIGAGTPVIIIIALFAAGLAVIGYRRELLFYLGIIGLSGLLNVLLKQIFHRARPDISRIIEASGFSFPSGHSMSAFTLYGITIYFVWKHLRYAWLRLTVIILGSFLILMIGASRIYLGVHYPSDVIGGYLISGAWLSISIGLYERFLERRWRSRKLRARATG
ncbi:phosphatase PAP2 family protein [Cohnella yongneupensis]|uniref:Phosphatase PAP2 family protein n=1 Tax=Cohnella yongneupensis TaxID=425006 RepID=A0ABW0R0I1_9BACL